MYHDLDKMKPHWLIHGTQRCVHLASNEGGMKKEKENKKEVQELSHLFTLISLPKATQIHLKVVNLHKSDGK